jgi:uncharacterized pyridoxamine 5'-phosphate oxidase family protein
MFETADDFTWLQSLLDRSYERSGAHLREIFSPELRLSAAELPDLMKGMQLLNVATVSSMGQPRVAPVDGVFFRGHFWFGSSPESLRFRHIRHNPAVSAVHTRGEELQVTVHGKARIMIVKSELLTSSNKDMVDLASYYVDVYGPQWRDWYPAAPYARIEPELMFASRCPSPDNPG